MDDTALNAISNKRVQVAQGKRAAKQPRRSNPLLAIDDMEDDQEVEDKEGQSSDEADAVSKLRPPKGLQGTFVDKDRSRRWGPFAFQWVWRVVPRGKNQGNYTMQWECTCGKHRDYDGDEAVCRKTRTFTDAEDCEVQFVWLKRWLLAGRQMQTRTDPTTGHRNYKEKDYPLIPVARLDDELARGIAAPTWIAPDDEDSEGGQGDEEKNQSGSSSDAESSSSSSS